MTQRRLVLAVAFTALAWIPFAIPDHDLPSVPTSAEWAVHATVFGLGALVWTLAAPRRWLWVVGIGLAAGGLVEGVQACCIEGRSGEWGDFGFDAVGLAVGLGVAWAVLRHRQRGAAEAYPPKRRSVASTGRR